MNIERWIKKNSISHEDRSGFVIGPFIRVQDLRALLKTHTIIPKNSSQGGKRVASKTE